MANGHRGQPPGEHPAPGPASALSPPGDSAQADSAERPPTSPRPATDSSRLPGAHARADSSRLPGAHARADSSSLPGAHARAETGPGAASGARPAVRSRIIIHVDMDAFYASVEQHDHPEYKGRPVIVGGDPKGGEGRGVVAASSYEARRFGIKSAMPIARAWRACPEGVFVRPRMQRYRDVSRQARKVFERFGGEHVEPVSIDEAYLDVTHLVGSTYPSAEAIGRALKDEVKAVTGITCSVGVAPSKSVAKIASDFQKPDGLTVVRPVDVLEFLGPLPVGRINGVGPKTATWLNELDVMTIGDLAAKSEEWVRGHFGQNGLYAWRIARGEDDRPVAPGHGLAKSRSEEHTFERDVSDVSVINRVVRSMARELVLEMRKRHVLFRVVGCRIRTSEFATFSRATTLRAPTGRLEPVMNALREQLAEFLDGKRRYRLVGVRLAGLERDVGQKTLEEIMAQEGVDPRGRLSDFPPWSVPGARVRRPGQQEFGRDL